MLASVSGAQLAEIRRQLGLTQVQLVEAPGPGSARSRTARLRGLETLRAYVVGLGGHLDIAARIGNIQLDIA